MATEDVVTRTARVHIEEDGIIRATVLPGTNQTLADAEENMQAQMRLMSGRRHGLLVDLRRIQSQDRDAREFYTRPESSKHIKAVALLIGSPMSRVIGNFMMGFNRSTVPTRLFTSDVEALAWLRDVCDS